jgi:hypothetical protein
MSDVNSIINQLQGLGKAKATVQGSQNSPLAEILTAITQDVVDQLREKMDKYNIDASGNLKADTRPTKVEVSGNRVSVAISSPEYWKYVNYGVNGTKVNRGAPQWGSTGATGAQFEASIAQWIRNKGITLPQNFSSYEGLNYVIRRSIREKGQEARPYFSDVVNEQLTQELRQPIERLMKKSIELVIIEPWQ